MKPKYFVFWPYFTQNIYVKHLPFVPSTKSVHDNHQRRGNRLFVVSRGRVRAVLSRGHRDNLLLLAQSGIDGAFAAIPELSNPSKEVLAKVTGVILTSRGCRGWMFLVDVAQ